MPPKPEYARAQRLKFVAKLAKLLAPTGSASTLQALNDAVFPGLADVPDAAFGSHIPALIATRCTAMPDTQELRTLLIDALTRTAGQPPSHTHASGGRAFAPVPPWMLQRIMEQCGFNPSHMLQSWLRVHGVDDEAIQASKREMLAERAQAKSDWSDPQIVLSAAASLEGHPMAGILGRMLHALVERHAPQNAGWVPPHFHPPTSLR